MVRCLWPWILVASLTAVIGLAALQATAAADDGPLPAPHLHLQTGTLDPLTLDKLDLAALPAEPTLLVVQFEGPPRPADVVALQAAGAEVGDYLPDYAYILRADGKTAERVARLAGVRWLGVYRPAWRVDPAVARRVAPGPVLVERWRAAAGKAGGMVASQQTTADGATARRLSEEADVLWIGAPMRPRLYNDVSRGSGIMRVEGAWARGLFGAGQTVAVADSGLDVGDPGRLSADFAGRVAATLPLTGTTWNDPVGHGTHVAGSILGNGVLSGSDPATHRYTGSLAGMAPEARLVVQAFQVDGTTGEIAGLPDDLEDLFTPAYTAGARLHSNSWGGPGEDEANPYGGYGVEARAIDRFTWSHPDFLPVFAAGNGATDGNLGAGDLGDGVVDWDSLSVAATAKNALAVGASEGLRTSGGMAGAPWLLFSLNGILGSGGIFLSEPIASDAVSDRAEGLAAFSGRGPTDDGRIKPDVVAPGTNILSTRSLDPAFDPAIQSWGVYEANDRYVFNGGTSMATPLAAGAATLVREYYQRAGLPTPSAALIKGTLIHHARDLSPGQYGEGATREMGPRPNVAEGWGRVDLGGLFAPDLTQWVDDRTAGVATAQEVVYTIATRRLTVTDASVPLRVTLAWTDYPAAGAAARQLVNDLDVDVIAPNGAVFPTALDRVNNVEMVEIDPPEVGAWQVIVRGVNVPHGPQPYALVVSGGLETPDTPRPYRVALPYLMGRGR